MNLAVILEARYVGTPDGKVWTKAPSVYNFWRLYHGVFEVVKIIARVKPVTAVDDSYHLVNGPSVTVCPVPHYVGLCEYLKRWRNVGQTIRCAVGPTDALLLRVPGALGNRVVGEFWRTRRPYGIEVVGDPYEVFSPGVFAHPLRPMLRYLSTRTLQKQCARASAASYVTSEILQRRYPLSKQISKVSAIQISADGLVERGRPFETHYSSIQLSAFNSTIPRWCFGLEREFRILFVGSLAQKYKGLDVLLRALAELHVAGVSLHLTVIGDGRYRAEMESLAQRLKLDGLVQFIGEVPSGKPIEAEMDRSGLLIVPSRTEGLPRVVLEAMACGLPCIASHVGGIPELLEDEDMVPANDPSLLAAKIREVLASPERLRRMSRRNLRRAKDYQFETLQARREQFLNELRTRTEKWLKQQKEVDTCASST